MSQDAPTSRRGFLGMITGGLTTTMAGCTASDDSIITGGTQNTPSAVKSETITSDTASSITSPTIAILAAGSLQYAIENGLRSSLEVPIQVESHGSATVARLIADGQRDPDIVTVADTALFDQPLSPRWHSIFTSNAIVLAYNPDTAGGRRLAAADAWYEPLLNETIRFGRTDPDQDPLGYRTLFMLELASRYYDDASRLIPAFKNRNNIYPETGLISRFETGSIDAAVTYRNMAIERDYAYVDLPDQINLSNPQYVDSWYSTVSYTLPSGQTINGNIINYGSTIRHMSKAAVAVFNIHTTGQYLTDAGFIQRAQFPQYVGDVPVTVEQAIPSNATSTNGESPAKSSLGSLTNVEIDSLRILR